jgi:hypothetical protein
MGLANIRYLALNALNLIRCGKPLAIRLTVSRIWRDLESMLQKLFLIVTDEEARLS